MKNRYYASFCAAHARALSRDLFTYLLPTPTEAWPNNAIYTAEFMSANETNAILTAFLNSARARRGRCRRSK